MAIQLSEAAVKHVKELKRAQNLPDDVFLRMGVKGGGCSGLSYLLEFDNELRPQDKQFEIDGVTVVCDAKSYLYLNSTTLDYVKQGTAAGEPPWANGTDPPIDYQSVVYYSAPRRKVTPGSLEEVDPKLLQTFAKLGIPLEEQKRLSGVAVDAVFDSVSVATTFK